MPGNVAMPLPLPQTYPLHESLGYNDFVPSSQHPMGAQSPLQVVLVLPDYETSHSTPYGAATRAQAEARRGSRLTARPYRRQLLGLESDTSTSSSTVHLSFKEEFNLSFSSCMDISDIVESHSNSHTDEGKEASPYHPPPISP